MASKLFNLVLDLSGRGLVPHIEIRRNDYDSNVFSVQVTQNGLPFDFTGMNPIFECLTPDGHYIRDDGSQFDTINVLDAEQGKLEYTLVNEIFAVLGQIDVAYFAFEQQDADLQNPTNRVSTGNFTFNVIADALTGTTAAADYMSDVTTLIQQINQLKTDYQTLNPANYVTQTQFGTQNDSTAAQLADEAQQLDDTQQQQKVQTKDTCGTFENAVVKSVIANGAGGNRPQVIGITPENDSMLALYSNRDSVALYGANQSKKTTLTISAGVTYTDHSVIIPDGTDLSGIIVGMIIDTQHNPKFSGIISEIGANFISVYHWYQLGNTNVGQVPDSTAGVKINPQTKIWYENGAVTLNASDPVTACTGSEIDVINNQADGGDTQAYHASSQGSFRPDAGLRVGGNSPTNHFINGVRDINSDNLARSDNPDVTKFLIYQSVSGYTLRNDGRANRLRGIIGTSAQTTTIQPSNMMAFLITQPVTHYIVDPSNQTECIIFVINNTDATVNIGGNFTNPTTSGSLAIEAHSFKLLISNELYWYHS